MTLKQFAEAHSLNPATARTWLKRGRIVKREDGTFQFAETLKRDTAIETQSETLGETAIETRNAETLKHTAAPVGWDYHEWCDVLDLVNSLRADNASLRATVAELEARILAIEMLGPIPPAAGAIARLAGILATPAGERELPARLIKPSQYIDAPGPECGA